jgi:hypothetical protein
MKNVLDEAIKIVNYIIARHVLKYSGNVILNSIFLVPSLMELIQRPHKQLTGFLQPVGSPSLVYNLLCIFFHRLAF